MKSDIVVWIGCFLVFVAGVLWSPIVINYEFNNFGFGFLKSILECASYIATIVAACFAVAALTVWRKQFKHAERFKALNEISDAAVGLSIVGDYIYSVTDKLMRDRLNKAGLGAKKDSSDIIQDEWWKAFRTVTTILEKNSIFLEEDEYSSISSYLSEIKSDQRKFVSNFFKELKEFDSSKMDEMVEFAEVWRLAMLEHIDELKSYIRKVRKNSIG